jgi:hypothetical protein
MIDVTLVSGILGEQRQSGEGRKKESHDADDNTHACADNNQKKTKQKTRQRRTIVSCMGV